MLLTSQVERDSELYVRRRERMTALVAELRDRTALVAAGGGEASVERHRSRGKLTARCFWRSSSTSAVIAALFFRASSPFASTRVVSTVTRR